jgi:hypothetical protein
VRIGRKAFLGQKSKCVKGKGERDEEGVVSLYRAESTCVPFFLLRSICG